MDTAYKSSLDNCALSMMSKMFFFELCDPIHPSLKVIGEARVTGVVIHELSPPELLIKSDEDDPEYYLISDLLISPALSIAV